MKRRTLVVGLIVWLGIGACVGCLWPSGGLHAQFQNWSVFLSGSPTQMKLVLLLMWVLFGGVAFYYVIGGLWLLCSVWEKSKGVDLSGENIREVLYKEDDVLTG